MNVTSDQICWNGLFPQPSTSDDASEFAYLHTGKNILVTGAGGCIGSALAKTIHRFRPRCLLLIASEQALYRIHSDFSQAGSQCHVPMLGSIADERCLRDTFQRRRPEIIYRAAAFKHVPLTEMNAFVAVHNHVFATSALAMLGQHFDVRRLIMISTDKSVPSQNHMGASKLLTEPVLLIMPASAACMAAIRLGNVLGLGGSVVPLLDEQIARGGPVTVTDPDVEGYFLTMEATVQRVLAGAASRPGNGAIAKPVIGAPIWITDLARHLIAPAPAKDVEITYTGLGPGDKLKEQFVSDREAVMGAPVDGVQWVDSPSVPEAEVASGLAELNTALDETNLSQLLTARTRLVTQYEPSSFLLQQAGFSMAY